MRQFIGTSLVLAGTALAPLQGAPQTLIISGGGNSGMTHQTYYNDCEYVYLTELSRGIDPIVVAEAGQWQFVNDPSRSFPAFTMADLEAAFRLLASELEPGDPVDIHISDHGDIAPEGEPGWNGSFILYQADGTDAWLDISHRAFQDLVQRHIPVENPVRLVGSYCFSGGLHQLAFTLPHVVCSTLTDFRSEAFRKTGHDLTYSNKVWGTFHSSQQKTPRTLYHAHWTAMTGEGMNDGRGSLSSMAYVDSVLGQGPFAALPAKAVAKCEKHASLVHSGEIQRLLQLSFDGPGRPAAAIQPLEDPDGWQVLARSESIRTVEEADEDSWSQVSRSEAGPLPLPALGPERAAMMGLLQADLARDYDLAKKDHAKAALARKRELLRMEEEWNQLSWFQRALRSALPPFFGRQSWEDQADFELAKYSHLLRRAEFLRNLEEFLSTARPDQVDKFFQLFQQELGPLD